MSAASNTLENKVLDHVLRNTSYSQPSVLKVALFAGAASDVLIALESGSGARTAGNWGYYEITGGAYVRTTIQFAAASGGTATSNGSNATFSTADANYNNEAASGSTITCIAVMDGAFTPDGSTTHTGNVLFYGQLDNAKEVLSGDTFQITAGNLTISLA